MVWHKKQNNVADTANKKEVKVKEEGVDNMKKEREKQKKVVDAKEEEKQKKEEEKKRKEKEEEKRKKKKKQMDKEKEKKHKAGKDKEAKDKEEKEKAMGDNEVKNKEEKEKARKDKEAKNKEEKERKDKEAKDKEEKARKDNEAKVKEEKEKARKDKEKNAKEEKEKKEKEKEEEGEQKKRKEKKEEEKKEREEKDKNDKNIYPHFYKVVIPEQSKEQLRIPLAFNKYLEDESPGVVSLKGPSGNIWRVELVANSEELCFVHGWKEFVSDHRIKLGYFLVFRYDGPSKFSVQVFDQTACETQYAFLARPRNDVVIEDDEEDIGSNVDGASQDAIGDMGSDASDTSEEDDEWHMGSDDALDTSQDDQGGMDNNADGTSQANDTSMGIGAINTAETLVLQDNTGTMTKGSRKVDGATRRRFRKVDELMANVYPSKKYKAEDKMSGASSGACKEVASSPSNSFEDSVTSKLVTSNEKPSYDKLDRLRSTLLNKSNDAPRPGKVVVTKVQRRPRLISQRRPITEKEKGHVAEQATDFKSKRPFTWKIMKYCEVYTTYFMVIPYSFVQKYLPKYNMKMTLWDPQGKSWRVSYVYFSDRSSGAFSAGWGAFAVGNNLEKFDACVFELLDKSYNIKVHIYRVVREIMPCILRSDANR